MVESKLTRLRDRLLLRRSSTSSTQAESAPVSPYSETGRTSASKAQSNVSLTRTTEQTTKSVSESAKEEEEEEEEEEPMSTSDTARLSKQREPSSGVRISGGKAKASNIKKEAFALPHSSVSSAPGPPTRPDSCPKVILERPTPETSREGTLDNIQEGLDTSAAKANAQRDEFTSKSAPPTQAPRPNLAQRRQSLVPYSQTRLINTLLESDKLPQPSQSTQADYFAGALPSIQPNMIHRKIWVKRPGASATLVSIHEDDVVDDLRDAILKKYANSLGRNFDAPDVTLKIIARDHSGRSSNAERTLGPEEPIGRTLDAYYPGGQMVDDALVIDVPQRRTPRPSPRPGQQMPPYYFTETAPPGEGGEYFPPMPAIPSPHFPPSVATSNGQQSSHHASIHSMSVLTTGQLPPLPSPGGRGTRHQKRPTNTRQHTSSPTILTHASNSADRKQSAINGLPEVPQPPPLPTPPAPGVDAMNPHKVVTPPVPVVSPRPPAKAKKAKKPSPPNELPPSNLPSGLLDSSIPPISVLIVEDNIINLKLLEAFMKRLKVRWQTAMNGREAVNKWRKGGFHLVLMDIQLPVLNGLDATKEIRRLERVNNIGAFSTSVSDSSTPTSTTPLSGPDDPPKEADYLENPAIFKSPVIIVALTASSLQSDRHEALAAGCNDFLTKPVNFVWLERKVTEWGCMQALIDYDGWRKWKDFSSPPSSSKTPTNKDHPSLIEAVKSQKSGNSSPASQKTITTQEQSPVAQRSSGAMANGTVGKSSKKSGQRRGNSMSLTRGDGGNEEGS